METKKLLATLAFLAALCGYSQTDTVAVRRPITAAAEVIGINVGVWSLNRYVAEAPFAYIGFNTIKRNFRTGFVWDNDKFSTNMFMHPYHGGLYFNAARTNGLSFGWSAVSALGGSMMWELFMESEPPSINDIFATTLGGIAMGEVTFRLAHAVIDNRQRGWNRVWRETAATMISPVVGFNRLMRGDLWRTSTKKDAYEALPDTMVQIGIEGGATFLSPSGKISRGVYSGFIMMDLTYGDMIKYRYEKPYDYFSIHGDLVLRKTISMGDISLMGRIYSKEKEKANGGKLIWGIFQHFDYIVKDTGTNTRRSVPIQVSAAGVVGIGIVRYHPSPTKKITFENSLHLNAVFLGGTHSDYYSILERDYNLGSGYSIKSLNKISMGRHQINFNYHLLHLFTWRNKIDSLYYRTLDSHYLDVQGTPGNTQVHILQGGYRYQFSNHLMAAFNCFYSHRRSYYTDFQSVTANTLRLTLGLGFRF